MWGCLPNSETCAAFFFDVARVPWAFPSCKAPPVRTNAGSLVGREPAGTGTVAGAQMVAKMDAGIGSSRVMSLGIPEERAQSGLLGKPVFAARVFWLAPAGFRSRFGQMVPTPGDFKRARKVLFSRVSLYPLFGKYSNLPVPRAYAQSLCSLCVEGVCTNHASRLLPDVVEWVFVLSCLCVCV